MICLFFSGTATSSYPLLAAPCLCGLESRSDSCLRYSSSFLVWSSILSPTLFLEIKGKSCQRHESSNIGAAHYCTYTCT